MSSSTANKRPAALVIGAAGGIGSGVSKALVERGWRVRALSRNPDTARNEAAQIGAVEWVGGDAMREADVIAAAQDVQVIVHAVNPAGYRNWRELALPMLKHSIAAARVSGARVMLPGAIYNFGPDALPVLRETSPQNPETRKGLVRLEMEQILENASRSGVRSIVLRAGDFFGPHKRMSWFRGVLVKPGKPVRSVTYPGERGVGHAWAYLPDLAEAMARLIELEETLPAFDVYHFAGHWLEDGTEMAHAVRRMAGHSDVTIKSFPWTMIRLLSPFVPLFRELVEVRYWWQVPARLDNSKLVALLGEEPHTPLDDAVRNTLSELGCLPELAAVPSPA